MYILGSLVSTKMYPHNRDARGYVTRLRSRRSPSRNSSSTPRVTSIRKAKNSSPLATQLKKTSTPGRVNLSLMSKGSSSSNTNSRNSSKPSSQQSKKSVVSTKVAKAKRAFCEKFYTTRSIMRQINRLQNMVSFLIPRLPFARVVRELLQDTTEANVSYRFTNAALEGLQTSAEAYIVQYFRDASKLSYHARRVTLKVEDMKLLTELRSEFEHFF